MVRRGREVAAPACRALADRRPIVVTALGRAHANPLGRAPGIAALSRRPTRPERFARVADAETGHVA